MQYVKMALTGLAVLSALVSAALWFWAAWGIQIDASEFGDFRPKENPLDQRYRKQARLNASAAIATGMSALFQALSLALS
jgi:hypothetical protein